MHNGEHDDVGGFNRVEDAEWETTEHRSAHGTLNDRAGLGILANRAGNPIDFDAEFLTQTPTLHTVPFRRSRELTRGARPEDHVSQ